MNVRTFRPHVSAENAVDRTTRISLGALLREKVMSVFDRDDLPDAVYAVYYPNYIASTTVELRRYVRATRTLRFLVGIDAITGRVGEIDVSVPDRVVETVDPATVLEPSLDEREAEAAWREWLWKYLDRKYRPVKRPETSLDEIELFYVPYWIVDYGSKEDSFAVSGLTKGAERATAIKPLAAYYDDALS